MVGLLGLVAVAGLCCPTARAQVIPATEGLFQRPVPAGAITPVANAPGSPTPSALTMAVDAVPVSPLLPPPAGPPPNVPGPYFEHDPLLDPAQLPQPGWFADADVALLFTHIERESFLAGTPVGFVSTTPAALIGAKSGLNGVPAAYVPQAHLDAAISPRFQFGYRLPAGFGEIALSYRFMSMTGDQEFINNDGAGHLHGRFDLQVADLEYGSHELSLWTWADMRWNVGIRFATLFFDDNLSTPGGLAPGGDNVVDQRFSNHYYGFGPKWGLQLAGCLYEQELSWLVKLDGSFLFGRISQRYAETSPSGNHAFFTTSMVAPTLNVQAGLHWRAGDGLDLFGGYQFEYWWDTARIPAIDSRGEFYDQGVVVRASVRW
jgi:hypothetical protein